LGVIFVLGGWCIVFDFSCDCIKSSTITDDATVTDETDGYDKTIIDKTSFDSSSSVPVDHLDDFGKTHATHHDGIPQTIKQINDDRNDEVGELHEENGSGGEEEEEAIEIIRKEEEVHILSSNTTVVVNGNQKVVPIAEKSGGSNDDDDKIDFIEEQERDNEEETISESSSTTTATTTEIATTKDDDEKQLSLSPKDRENRRIHRVVVDTISRFGGFVKESLKEDAQVVFL